jgi:putative ABC transport system substrate-binding protein
MLSPGLGAVMRRRKFLGLVGGAVAWPVAARAQQLERMHRVGVLIGDAETGPYGSEITAFQQEMTKLGWNAGKNINIEYRYPSADPKNIQATVAEMVASAPDLIVSNYNLVTAILQATTRTIPIVFVGASDPLASGFVTDLARPTGNLTGFANFVPSMGGKWLEKLREVAPQIERAGFMLHPETPPNVGFLKSAEAASPSLNVKIVSLGVHDGPEIEREVAKFATVPQGGLVIAPHAVTFANGHLIIALAARNRLPTVFPLAFFAKAGGLISYGNNVPEQLRQTAGYVDKLLKGGRVSDLPVQHPTKFEVVINLKTAKALGLKIPEALLLHADEVIE